jgi:hypothetical protein
MQAPLLRHELGRPPQQRLARPLKPAAMDELGRRGSLSHRLKRPSRQARSHDVPWASPRRGQVVLGVSLRPAPRRSAWRFEVGRRPK